MTGVVALAFLPKWLELTAAASLTWLFADRLAPNVRVARGDLVPAGTGRGRLLSGSTRRSVFMVSGFSFPLAPDGASSGPSEVATSDSGDGRKAAELVRHGRSPRRTNSGSGPILCEA